MRALHERCVRLVEAEAAWAAGRLDGAEAVLWDVVDRGRGIEATVLVEAEAELAVLLAAGGRVDDAVRALEALLDRVAPTGAWARVAQSGHGLVPVLRCVDARWRGEADGVDELAGEQGCLERTGAAGPVGAAVGGRAEQVADRGV